MVIVTDRARVALKKIGTENKKTAFRIVMQGFG